MNSLPSALSVRTTSLAVSGTILDVEIRRLLRSLAYPPCNVHAALEWVETHGTIEGAEFIEREDYGAITALLARYTGDAEGEPADWPAWTDSECWVPTEPEPDDAPFEPDPADRAWWAQHADDDTLGSLNRENIDPLANALPYPAVFPDDTLDWLERHEATQASRITDEDIINATGCCG